MSKEKFHAPEEKEWLESILIPDNSQCFKSCALQ